MNAKPSLLREFEALELSAPDFHHESHIRVAFEMLEAYDFVDACARYAKTIQAMAQKVGVPEKFNATITFAYMSLVAERKADFSQAGADAFIASNPDLLDKSLLHHWYSEERLTSAAARNQFLLPDLGGRVA